MLQFRLDCGSCLHPGSLFLAASICLSTTEIQAETVAFRADYRYWHEATESALEQVRLTVGSRGFRVEQQLQGSGNVFLVNHDDDRFWFLDRHRQLVHAVPVHVSTVGESGPASTSTSTSAPAPDAPIAGIVHDEPCSGIGFGDEMQKTLKGQELHRGRMLERWHCTFEGALLEEHWFSRDLGLVQRIEHAHGFVSELTNIHRLDDKTLVFRPPSHYRLVEIEELINPAVPISSYIEKKPGQH